MHAKHTAMHLVAKVTEEEKERKQQQQLKKLLPHYHR